MTRGRWRLAAAALVLWVSGPPLWGQDKSAFPFVDLGKAQALVDVLTKEIESLKADSARLRKEAADLSAQRVTAQKGSIDLVALWDETKAQYSQLATIDEQIVDRGLKARSTEAAQRAQALLSRLSRRMAELGQQAARLGEDIQARLDQASVDDARVVRNTDDIIILQATIARTKAQQGRLEDVIGSLDALSARADAALR